MPTRATSGKKLTEARLVPQPDFRSSPYEESTWEIIGKLSESSLFEPLACPIIGETNFAIDFRPAAFEVTGIAQTEKLSGSRTESHSVQQEQQNQISAELLSQQLKEEFEEGRAEGFHDGYEQGLAAGRAESEQVMAELQRFQQAVSQRIDDFLLSSEKNCVNLSLKIAKRLLLTTAEARPEYIIEVVREGLKAIGAAKPLRIRVSTQDFEFLEVIGMPPELSSHELGAEYVLDETIKAGCVIETQFGEVDLQLERMWEQVAAELFEATR